MIIDRRANLPPVSNQGSEPKCVAYAFRALAFEAGYDVEADYIYEQAQLLDDIPGEDYNGTQLIGGVRMLRKSGLAGRIRAVQSKRTQILDALTKSCVVLACHNSLFGITKDGTHASGSEFTTNVTTSGTAGSRSRCSFPT